MRVTATDLADVLGDEALSRDVAPMAGPSRSVLAWIGTVQQILVEAAHVAPPEARHLRRERNRWKKRRAQDRGAAVSLRLYTDAVSLARAGLLTPLAWAYLYATRKWHMDASLLDVLMPDDFGERAEALEWDG